MVLNFRRQKDEETAASCNASCARVAINSVWKNKGSEGLEQGRGNQREQSVTLGVLFVVHQEGDGVRAIVNVIGEQKQTMC